MSTTVPGGSRSDGRSTIFWKIQGCEDLRSVFKRTKGNSDSADIADPLIDIRVDRVVRRLQFGAFEEVGPHGFEVVGAEGVVEDWREVIDPDLRRPQQIRIVEAGVHEAGVDESPSVAEVVGVNAVDGETAPTRIVEHGDAVVLS